MIVCYSFYWTSEPYTGFSSASSWRGCDSSPQATGIFTPFSLKRGEIIVVGTSKLDETSVGFLIAVPLG